jgi:hypothetical protein
VESGDWETAAALAGAGNPQTNVFKNEKQKSSKKRQRGRHARAFTLLYFAFVAPL